MQCQLCVASVTAAVTSDCTHLSVTTNHGMSRLIVSLTCCCRCSLRLVGLAGGDWCAWLVRSQRAADLVPHFVHRLLYAVAGLIGGLCQIVARLAAGVGMVVSTQSRVVRALTTQQRADDENKDRSDSERTPVGRVRAGDV